MAVPDNILWAFFSEGDHAVKELISKQSNKSDLITDTYFKNTNGDWVLVTNVFECIEEARSLLRCAGATKYLGAVLKDTKTEVKHGTPFPPKPEKEKGHINPQLKERLLKYKEGKKSNFKGASKFETAYDYWDYIYTISNNPRF